MNTKFIFMKLTDKRFWIAWAVLILLMVRVCIIEEWSEDTSLLGVIYTLSLLSTWLCYRIRPRIAFVNLIVMIGYNAILGYNLAFNSRYGTGLTWWFFALLLNAIQSIVLLVFTINGTIKRKKHEADR